MANADLARVAIGLNFSRSRVYRIRPVRLLPDGHRCERSHRVVDADNPPRRRWFVLVLAVVVLVAAAVIALVAGTGGDGRGDAARSSGAPASSASTVPARPDLPRRTGITFGSALYRWPAASVRAALDDVRRLHMSWIRVDLSWTEVQPVSPDRFDWRKLDLVVREAATRKLSVLGLLTYTPGWARAAGCRGGFVCPPRSAAEFADFASAAVERYAGRGITTYQLWNEPNLDQFWTSPDPDAYGRLVAAAVPAMRAATSRTLTVLTGGLGYAGTDTAARARGDVDAGRFLARACALSRCRVDAVGYDPATYPNLPSAETDPANAWQLLSRSAPGRTALRAAMAGVGLGDKQVWITGFGAPTTYPGATSGRVVSERVQGQILLDGLRLAGRARASVGAFFVDTLRDTAARGTFRDHFGLLRSDDTRKPAYGVLQSELAR